MFFKQIYIIRAIVTQVHPLFQTTSRQVAVLDEAQEQEQGTLEITALI